MIFLHQNYRAYLESELKKRARARPGYSLRAFAADLKISPSDLSQIMTGKRPLSLKKAYVIAEKLGLSTLEVDFFGMLAEIESEKDADRRAILEKKIRERSTQFRKKDQLDLTKFRTISDWFGPAILELVCEIKTPHTPEEIARHFGITEQEAESTLLRLQKLELVEAMEEGRFRRCRERIFVEADEPSMITNRYFSSLLEPMQAILEKESPTPENEGIPLKKFGAEVFAFDPDQLPEMKLLMDEYLTRVNELAAKGKNRTIIFQAFTALFPLTKKENTA